MRHMAPMTARVLALFLLGGSLAASQNFPLRSADTSKSNQSKAAPVRVAPSSTAQATAPHSQSTDSPDSQRPLSNGERFYEWLWKWMEPQSFANLLLFFTAGVAFIIGLRTLKAIEAQNRLNLANLKTARRLAHAAKESADTGAKTLRLAAATYLDVKWHGVIPRTDNAGNVTSVVVSYRLQNLSDNVARNVEMQATYGVGDAMNRTERTLLSILSPKKGAWFRMNVPVTPEQRQEFADRTLWMRINMAATWINPLDEENARIFHRILRFNPVSNEWESQILGGAPEDNQAQGAEH
jgi:hypothetical protein